MDVKCMQYKNLKHHYCCANCVFFDTCKANIGQCVIFQIEQLLSDLVLKEFELEIFRLNFGMADGIHYSISEIAKKYNISEFKVKRSIGSVLRRLRHPSRRQKYLSLIEIIMSTDEITPYSLMIKAIYQYRGTNAEFWEEFKGKIEESLSLEQCNVFYNINEFNVIHKWTYRNEKGTRVIKRKI